MNKLIKISNLVFTILFAVISITAAVGYFIGKGSHCGGAAILTAILALILYSEYKHQK